MIEIFSEEQVSEIINQRKRNFPYNISSSRAPTKLSFVILPNCDNFLFYSDKGLIGFFDNNYKISRVPSISEKYKMRYPTNGPSVVFIREEDQKDSTLINSFIEACYTDQRCSFFNSFSLFVDELKTRRSFL